MTLTSISLGSNIEREVNIRKAVELLREAYPDLIVSPVYQTAAVGFAGDDFLNLVVCFDTDEPVQAVHDRLKAIEDRLGRDRNQPKFSARKIDLDLLTYGDLVFDRDGLQLPRDEILSNAFVLKPLSDIMGDEIHPTLARTYRELWCDMAPRAGRIELFDLPLN